VNARVPIYEGDGLFHDPLARAARPARVRVARPAPVEVKPAAPARVERTAPAPASVGFELSREEIDAAERRAHALRAEMAAGIFGRLFRAIGAFFVGVENALYRAQQRDVERYLSQATDNVDLERRLRELERSPNLDPYWSRR